MVCIQRPYYHFGVQRHIYISILEIPAHIYIYVYIYNYIFVCKWGSSGLRTQTLLLSIYITFDS